MYARNSNADPLALVSEEEPSLASLPLHSHPCSIYETADQLKQQFVPYLRSGLVLREKCVYFVNENDEQFVIDSMQDQGFDVKPFLASGQFEIIHTEHAHLAGGHFGEEKMLAYWNQAIDGALKAGYSGLRAAVEMTWALSGKPGCEILASYESRLTNLMSEKPASVICMYSRRKFSPDKIKAIIHAHPLVVTNDTVLVNPACPPPEKFDEGSVDLDIQATLDNLELIRELRRTQRELQEHIREESSFRLLVAGVKDYAIFMLDPDGKIVTWNDGAQRAKGYTAKEAIGQHFSMFYTPDAKSKEHPQKELEIAKEEGYYEEEGWRVRKDGSLFWANVVITALYEDGNLIGFGKVTRDLSDKKQAESAREKALEQVTKTNEEMQKLAFVISHELQEPISLVTSYSRLLLSRYKDRLGEDADEFLEHIQKGALTTARLVDDLWTYARVTKRGATRVNINIGVILKDAQDELKQLVESSGAQITSPGSEDFPTVECIREQIQYVLKELITNAIKHHRGTEPPTIEITVLKERNGWSFNFHDNGPGIDRFFAQQAFTVYQKVDGRADANGTGIGLPICKKIIEENHGGRIGFESKEGDGSKFFFWLPNSDP